MKRPLILFSLLVFLVQTAYCNTNDKANIKTITDKPFVLGLDLGVARINQLGNSVSFPLGYSTFNYTPDTNHLSSTRYGISLGRIFMLNSLNSIILGLGYHQFNRMHVSGTLQQGVFPPLYSANYQYRMRLSQLLAEVKLQHEWHKLFYPYVTAGIGSAFNKTTHFTTTVPDYLTVTPNYTDHSADSLSYMLGLGMNVQFAPTVSGGVGYVFSDLGHVGLGDGVIRERTLPNYLNQSHLYINTFLAQLNWYF